MEMTTVLFIITENFLVLRTIWLLIIENLIEIFRQKDWDRV